jgi:FAD:protein FMN transferase
MAGARRDVLCRGVREAYARIARIHSLMSFHDPSSELSVLNREGYRPDVMVSPDSFAVLRLAYDVFRQSGGAFDVTVADLLARWGYLPKRVTSRKPISDQMFAASGPGKTARAPCDPS